MIDDERLPAFPETATCVYCRGSLRHGARERCPAAPPLAPPASPLQEQAPTAMSAGTFERPYPRGRSFPSSGYGRGRYTGVKQASPFGFWRFVGGSTGTIVLMVCVSVYAWMVFDDLTSTYQGGEALLGLTVTVLVGGLGVALLWKSWRAYAKAVFVFLAATLILLGYFMLIFAPVYRQINASGIAEYQAFNALLLFGLLTLGSGIGLSALCLRWALEPEARAKLTRWRRPIGAAYGVLLGLFGLLVIMLLGLALSVTSSESSEFESDEIGIVALVIAFTALAMQFFIPGMILTFHGIRSSIGSGTSAFRPPWAIAIAAAFGVVVVVGQANMRLDSPYAWPMPALHTLAAVLPGVTYIAFAMRASWLRGRLVRGITWRQITLAWGLAIAVGAMMAGFVNSIGGFGVTVLLLVYNGAFEDVSAVSAEFEYDVWDVISDTEFWLTSTQQWVANVIAIAIIPPFAEEFLKGLSVLFLLTRTMTRGQAFALGASAGAGFGFVEALLYGAGVVADDLSAWWEIMLIRAGSTSLHCLATGLVGLGWWYWTNGDDKRRAVSLYFTAVILHAIWNGFAVTLDSEIFWIGTLEDKAIEYVAYGFVIVMAAAFISLIPLIARGLREPPPQPVADTPLGAMRPWMAV